MQIRNNYDILWKKTDGTQVGTGIFNGDIGVITEIDLNAELLTVVFDDRQAEYDFDMLRELELAYAMTVHKSQGSEYQAVVLAAWSCAPNLRTRRVPLYGHNPGEKAPCGGGAGRTSSRP